MKEVKQKTGNSSDSRAESELQKLRLEIENLKYKNRWENRIAVYIPLISTLVAVSGFLFGIYQYQAQQSFQHERSITEQQKERAAKELEQAIRIQDQIRIDVDQLLQFTSKKEQTISRVVFILDDLNRLLDYSDNEQQKTSAKLQGQKRVITKSLVESINNDCDFNDPRDVKFSLSIMNNWNDYLEYLKGDPDKVQIFVEKYISALDKLHQDAPEFLESIDYNADNDEFNYTGGDTTLLYRFNNLQSCFSGHLELLEQRSELRTEYIRRFQSVICNPTLTKQLFDESFSDVDCSD